MHRRGVMRLAAGASAPALTLPATDRLLFDFNATLGYSLTGSDVDTWTDQSSRGLVATGVASRKPTWSATGGPNGTPAMVVTGGQSMLLSAAIRPTSGPITVMVVFDDTSPSNAFRYIADSTIGRRIIEQVSINGNVSYYDGSTHRYISPRVSGAQCLTWALQSSGGTVYRARSILGSDVYTESAMGGACTLFSDRNTTASWSHGKFSRIVAWDKILSGPELTQAWDYMHALYGVAP